MRIGRIKEKKKEKKREKKEKKMWEGGWCLKIFDLSFYLTDLSLKICCYCILVLSLAMFGSYYINNKEIFDI